MRSVAKLALAALLPLSSCGGTDVTPVGNNTYIVGVTGTWASGTELKVEAYKKAMAFCAQRGQAPETMFENSNEVSVLQYPHGEITFRCVPTKA
jgi:hypothetical protein